MADDNWQKVREVFDAALQQKPEERQSYINQVCSDDKTLLMEIESLFSSFDRAEDFMETPAVATVADIIEPETKTLESGKCFTHYELIKQIGTGGMGEVYLAQDKKLDRKVAVKILNERFSQDRASLRRFIREAKAASALNHPNILVIHEIGETDEAHYIVSEFIEGETLREVLIKSQMSLREVLDISIQIANALTIAHEVHLIHRDIKPENVMIRPDGLVKVLDFGLAKLIEEKNNSFLSLRESSGRRSQTAEGIILGTVNYMSPEQAKAGRVDERTDIFSLGVTVYEMIAGQTPFADGSTSETFAKLLYDEPQPLSHFASNVPDELQRIVSKTLCKNKDERYQTMKEVLTDLKALKETITLEERLKRSASPDGNATTVLQATTGNANKSTAETLNSISQQIKRHKPLAAFACLLLLIGAIALSYYFFFAGKTTSNAGGKKSIAVLPLKPINTANRDEIYEYGIADSLIHYLGAMKGFIVRPLSATRKYANIEQDPIAAGKEQKTDYVLASNYQIAEGKIRIAAQLFNVQTGVIEETLLTEKEVADVFSMQDAVANDLGNSLLERFGKSVNNQTAKRYTNNREAYQFYLKGQYFWNRRSNANLQKAVEYFNKAVMIDPNYALAFAGLANCYALYNTYSVETADEAFPKAKTMAEKALALDETLAEAHTVLAFVLYRYEWNWARAENEFERALELNPNLSTAHHWYGEFLGATGRFDEAIAAQKLALQLEPTSFIINMDLGWNYFLARRYDEALAQYRTALEIEPNSSFVHYNFSTTFERQGKFTEAVEEYLITLQGNGFTWQQISPLKKAFASSDYKKFVRARIKWRQTVMTEKYPLQNIFIANDYAFLNEKDEAFAYLRKAFEKRDAELVYLKFNPIFDNLRGDPRFDDLVRRVGLK
jgi:serine/threonine protein kinase/Tfp pilus assembly protein PilF